MKQEKDIRGFKAVAQHIAKKEGYSMERASAILASAGRNASHAAHLKNPSLNKIK